MKKGFLILLCCTLVVGLRLNATNARPAYFKEFKEKYLKPEGTEEEKAFADLVNSKVKCNVCHGKNDQGKDDKKVRNVYGQALSDALGATKVKEKEKIQEALDAAAEKKASDDGPSFGELINMGKLPAGEE